MPEKISILKESGETLSSNVVSVFMIPDTQKKYIITTENAVDPHGLTVLHVSEIVDGALQKIATDDEWSSIKTIMRAIISGSVGSYQYLQTIDNIKANAQYARDISVSASAAKQMVDNYAAGDKSNVVANAAPVVPIAPVGPGVPAPNASIFPTDGAAPVANDDELIPGIAEVGVGAPSAQAAPNPAVPVVPPVVPAVPGVPMDAQSGISAPVDVMSPAAPVAPVVPDNGVIAPSIPLDNGVVAPSADPNLIGAAPGVPPIGVDSLAPAQPVMPVAPDNGLNNDVQVINGIVNDLNSGVVVGAPVPSQSSPLMNNLMTPPPVVQETTPAPEVAPVLVDAPVAETVPEVTAVPMPEATTVPDLMAEPAEVQVAPPAQTIPSAQIVQNAQPSITPEVKFNMDVTPSFAPNASLDEVVLAAQDMFMEGVKNLVQTIQEKVYRELYAKENELKTKEEVLNQREIMINEQMRVMMSNFAAMQGAPLIPTTPTKVEANNDNK